MPSILLPRVVGVQSLDSLISITDQVRQLDGHVELDCSQVRFFDPLGMTMLACTLECISEDRTVSMPWLSEQTTSYLERMDFFEKLEVGAVDIPRNRNRHDQRVNLLEIQRLVGPEKSEAIADQVATSIATKILGRPAWEASFEVLDVEFEQYFLPLRYALSELLENGLSHARRHGRGSAGVWVASQFISGKVHLAVVDNGCGFLATLRHHPELPDKTHEAAILTALRPKVSCNRDLGLYLESANEGVGLTTTVRLAKATGGSVHIASGNAIVFENGAAPQKRNDRALTVPAEWPGVAISAIFDATKLPLVKVSDHLPPLDKQPSNTPIGFDLRFDD